MKALLDTHGSRGYVQPFAALAAGLTDAGHEVVLAAPASSATLAEPHCARVIPLDDGTNKLVGDRAAWQAVESNFRGLRGKRLGWRLLRHNRLAMSRVFDDLAELTRHLVRADDVDVVVHQVNVPGQAIAERLGVPAVAVCLQPFWVPTASFPDPLFPYRLPAALNRTSYLSTKLFVRAFTGGIGRWRRTELDLPRRRHGRNPLRRPDGTPAPVVQAFSRHVLPAGADPHPRARAGEPFGNHLADPGGAAGYEGNLAGNVEQLLHVHRLHPLHAEVPPRHLRALTPPYRTPQFTQPDG